ncbi:hypothetical protein VaNZ11_016794 [Volvox africanus]|uniref:Sulfotransferase n=1 Tax=Volvox africanus TaxID=51714 RepID=A0ABQ5SPV2_9CHLO|nr:hypothetical protein VaNZ11_016794 [Volvox africanus]
MRKPVFTILSATLVLVTSATEASLQAGQHGRNQRDRNDAYRLNLVADRCVFILATGQSGSTALMDALNQLPHYLIRGEQWAAFWNIYESYLNFKWTTTEPQSQLKFNWTAYQDASLETIKNLYNQEAPREKLPWFNEFPQERIIAAIRSYYAVLYGYYGQSFVSGFKDSRYVCGRSFTTDRCAEFFNGFLPFLRSLCNKVKVLFNTRTSASLSANMKLYDMDRSRSEEDFLKELNETHALYDSYVAGNSDHAFRVFYEDMFDPAKNTTLAMEILEFLDEDPATPIRFNRMPDSNKPDS